MVIVMVEYNVREMVGEGALVDDGSGSGSGSGSGRGGWEVWLLEK